MLKFFRTISNRLTRQENDLIHLHYKVGEFLQIVIEISESRPIRDEIWVERTNHPLSYRAVGRIRPPADTTYK
ncbi:hypothetical protein [Rhodohalobacter sp.]|uniref:hypothetical protein n=1 Tax=Rhodohalobacter sp. TaxID=1974210 RepID=UPI002ACE160F|nr:hypothetical protein [Rhodohalobacter sp.]MDZ7755065.1 hypothetical protein [Rhodohalobacter sp.]